MNALLALLLLLILATLLVIGRAGLRNLLGLAMNFGLFFLIILLINWQINAILALIVSSVFMLAIAIFMSSDNGKVTEIAFKSSLTVVLGLTLIAMLAQHVGLFQGYTSDNMGELEGLSLNIGLNFSDVAVVVIVISMLGAVAEAAMAVTADLSELIEQEESRLTLADFSKHRQIVSQQIFGTSINTLFFGMFGTSIGLILWFVKLNYSLAIILNSKLLMADLASMLLGMLGILLVIELSGYLLQRDFSRQREPD